VLRTYINTKNISKYFNKKKKFCFELKFGGV
jgi:hypothetical protein